MIFTCSVYRAVHFELVEAMSTEAFILALRRFFARRRRSSVIYTDNGTNFSGLNNLFQHLDWNKITTETGVDQIIWKFIPPASPWWGGFWERVVGMLKDLLRKILGRSILTYEQFNTVLCDCEDIINNRPLTYTYSDSEELIPLTPAMFLKDIGLNNSNQNGIVDLDIIDEQHMSHKARYLQSLRKQLRERFQKEYLSELIQFNKRKIFQLKQNDIVLVESDNKKRVLWPLGRIMSTIPGVDGEHRLAKIKLADKIIVRPYQRLHLLEAAFTTDEDPATDHNSVESVISEKTENQSEKLQFSTRGRMIKKPSKLDL